jgi:RNA polymerase sigma-32 factor
MTDGLMSVQTTLPIPSIGSLQAYINAVRSLPMLEADEEEALARRFREQNDLEAARRLVMSHLRFVVRIARGYDGYGLAQGDLIQEGNVGLMKAVKRFDPAYGVRLVSFAVHWVRAEIHEFIVRNWRIVRMATTKAQRKLFFNLRSARRHLGWLRQDEAEDIARELGVEADEVRDMAARLGSFDHSLEVESAEDEGSSVARRALTDQRHDPAVLCEEAVDSQRRSDALNGALACLDARQRRIIQSRWLCEDEQRSTLHELAAELGVSAERVRQLEQRALTQMRSRLGPVAGANG